MEEQAILRLYALALALVPDVNAAGDLFMAARDADDLRRRAAAWWRRRGVTPPAEPAVAPELDEEQRDDALHLHRRGIHRRRQRPVLAAALVAVALVAAVGLRATLFRPPQGLAGASAFAATPAASFGANGSPSLYLYRAESTPDAIRIYWAVSGWHAPTAAAARRPQLRAGRRWLEPANTETAPDGQGRVVGRSTYAIMQLHWPAVTLMTPELDGAPIDWTQELPLSHRPDPESRTINLDRTVTVGPYTYTLQWLTRSPRFTQLHLLAKDVPRELRNLVRASVAFGVTPAGGTEFEETSPDEPLAVDLLFGPLPPGANSLTFAFPVPPTLTRPDTQPIVPAGSQWQSNGTRAGTTLPTGPGMSVAPGPGFFAGASSDRYTWRESVPTDRAPLPRGQRFNAENVPPGAGSGGRRPTVSVQVDLSR